MLNASLAASIQLKCSTFFFLLASSACQSPVEQTSSLMVVELAESAYLKEICNSKTEESPFRLNTISMGNMTVVSFVPDPCGKATAGLSLAGPAFKGIVNVDGYYAEGNPTVKADVQRSVNAYTNAGWKVINTSNQNSAQIQKTLDDARSQNPELFNGSLPYHYMGIAHGVSGGKQGTVVEAWDGKKSYNAYMADRAAASIKGAGGDVAAHIFASSCHSGAMIGCERESLKAVMPQVEGIHTASTADQLSWEKDNGSEQFLSSTLAGLSYDPKLDLNKDGQIYLSEVTP